MLKTLLVLAITAIVVWLSGAVAFFIEGTTTDMSLWTKVRMSATWPYLLWILFGWKE